MSWLTQMNLEDIKTEEPSPADKFLARLLIARYAKDIDDEWELLRESGLHE